MEILDASALLALLKKEKGYEIVKNLLHSARKNKNTVFMHQINYVEVIKKLLQFMDEGETKKIMTNLQQPFFGISNYLDDDLAGYASWIATNAKTSLGDAFGLAFTKIMGGRFWTADKALKHVAEKEKIQLRIIRD